MNRRAPLRALLTACLIAAPASVAQAYTTNSAIDVSRSFSPATASPGDTVEVTITVDVGSIGSDPIRGFFLSDHIPVDLSPTSGTVTLDGSAVPVAIETSAEGAVYAGCITARWVLEAPPSWSEGRPLGESSTVVITYQVTLPNDAQNGPLRFPGFTWVGMIPVQGNAGDHFGYEDSKPAITVEGGVDPGDPDAGNGGNGSGVDNRNLTGGCSTGAGSAGGLGLLLLLGVLGLGAHRSPSNGSQLTRVFATRSSAGLLVLAMACAGTGNIVDDVGHDDDGGSHDDGGGNDAGNHADAAPLSNITATQMGMLDFKEDQNLTAADMDGTNDVTSKLQAAVDNARSSYKSLFIPSGTYKVSDTINCVLDEGANPWKPTNIIGSSVQHPVIRLADNTSAFQSSTPKAVVYYQNSDSSHGTEWVMEGGIRGVDFDLGAGNTGAVAIYWGSAQYVFVEDINIDARDGFAGLTGFGGANNLLGNVNVTGGQHGLYLPSSSEADSWGGMWPADVSTISGCTFTDQSDIPLVLWSWAGVTLVGTTIVTDSDVAIEMRGSTYAAVVQFPFSMIDSKIEFTNPQASNTAIENALRGSVSLRGVYVKGAGTICNNNADEDLAPAAPITDWTGVRRYNYIDKAPRNDEDGQWYPGTHYDAVSGDRYNTAVVDVTASAPPADLTSKHIWASTPSFEDPDAVLVTTAAEIQEAINNNKKVCLAKGTYELSAPLTLKADTILLGCPGRGSNGSILTYGWMPTAQSWLIGTEDSASATTYLMDITTDPGNDDYLGSLHWRAGENSIIRDVWLDKSWDTNERDMIRMYFSGNGGGRVFNYQDEKGAEGDYNSNHRKVKVSGTTAQLTFYGLNLERGGILYPESSYPLIEMVSSSNIRIFGAKAETFQPYAIINNCQNVFLTNIVDFAANGGGMTRRNLIEIIGGSDHIEVSNAVFLKPPSAAYLIVDDPWNTNEPARTEHLGLYHRNWTSF